MTAFWAGFARRAPGLSVKTAAGHKAVSTVAVIRGGKILMGRRRDNGKWTTPGGHLEPHEDPLTGAVRELREESGIEADPKSLSHLKTETFTKPDGAKITVNAYVLHLGGKVQTSMQGDPDGEVHRWQWVNYASGLNPFIAEKLHVPFDRNVLLKALGAKPGRRTVSGEPGHPAQFHEALKGEFGQLEGLEAGHRQEKAASPFWRGFLALAGG